MVRNNTAKTTQRKEKTYIDFFFLSKNPICSSNLSQILKDKLKEYVQNKDTNLFFYKIANISRRSFIPTN